MTRVPGTFNVHSCDGIKRNIRSLRTAVRIARAHSSSRFARGGCHGATITRNDSVGADAILACDVKTCHRMGKYAGVAGARRRR